MYTTIIVALAVFTTETFAQGYGQRAQQGARISPQGQFAGMQNQAGLQRGPDKMMALLDLTDEQSAKVEKLHQANQKASLAIRNQINEKEARLRTLTTGDDVNINAASKVVKEIGDLKTSLELLKLNTHNSVRELLTDEQKIKFDTMPKQQGVGRGNQTNGMRNNRQPRGLK